MHLIQKIKSIFLKHPEEEEILETIEGIIDEREERGDSILIDPHELILVKNLFKMRELRAAQIMIPRVDIVGISIHASLEELKKIMSKTCFTRLLVYDKTLDNITGILHMKDVLRAILNNESTKISDIMTPSVLFVPSSIRSLDLLRELQKNKTQVAIVVDEHGGTNGFISLEDLLEVIVGEIEDEHDILEAPLFCRKINKSTIEVDAKILLSDLEKTTGKFWTREIEDMEIDTVGGLVFYTAKRIPNKGEVVIHPSGVTFQIIDSDSRRIKKVRIGRFKKSPLSCHSLDLKKKRKK